MSQPFFIKYAYLDLKNEDAVEEFFVDVKQSSKIGKIQKLPSEPNLSVSSVLQKEIFALLDAWFNHEIFSRELDKWLQNNRPTLVFLVLAPDPKTADVADFFKDGRYMQGYQNLNLRGFLIEEIIETMTAEKEVRKCEADDCKRFFIASKKGSGQLFCSAKCRNRTWAKKNR